ISDDRLSSTGGGKFSSRNALPSACGIICMVSCGCSGDCRPGARRNQKATRSGDFFDCRGAGAPECSIPTQLVGRMLLRPAFLYAPILLLGDWNCRTRGSVPEIGACFC